MCARAPMWKNLGKVTQLEEEHRRRREEEAGGEHGSSLFTGMT